jgi:hypothetical protein
MSKPTLRRVGQPDEKDNEHANTSPDAGATAPWDFVSQAIRLRLP